MEKISDEILLERARQNAFARELVERHSIDFSDLWYVLPDDPLSTPFTTPLKLSESGVTRYSDGQIRALFNQDKLSGAVRVGERQIILGVSAVEHVLERERQRLSGEFVAKGTKPGQPSPFKGRKRRPRQT